MKALTGIKVIDFSKWLPGQYCGMVLGDFGADVIKVETPTGDDTRRFFPEALPGMSYWHLALNRNKRGITADIKTEGGRKLLLRLLSEADVFLEGFRPGYLARYGWITQLSGKSTRSWSIVRSPALGRLAVTVINRPMT